MLRMVHTCDEVGVNSCSIINRDVRGDCVWGQLSHFADVPPASFLQGEKDADKPPPLEIQFAAKPKVHRLSKKEVSMSSRYQHFVSQVQVFHDGDGDGSSLHLKMILIITTIFMIGTNRRNQPRRQGRKRIERV